MTYTIYELGGRPLRVLLAETHEENETGLLGRSSLHDGEGMGFMGFPSLHTVGMLMSIDVVWLDKGGKIMAVDENVPPGRQLEPRAWCAIELADGWVERNLRQG